MKSNDIIALLPYDKPFLFVSEILSVDENGIIGTHTFLDSEDFYKGHFKDFPVTPGVLLTECCAQIGLVCMGIYLSQISTEAISTKSTVAMTESEMEFLKPVYPGERVQVRAEKVYFRFQKLKAKVFLYNLHGELACRGQIAGIIKSGD